MDQATPAGRIVTFYSYKGGTGRTMALANAAWILASAGKRVLVIDWDLEAPGLHRYLHPFLHDPTLSRSDGIIDFVVEFATAALTHQAPGDAGTTAANWFLPHANLLRYASSIDYPFPKPGTVDFVSSGRQDAGYAVRVNSFHWKNFYEVLGGGVFLEAVRSRLRTEYDYVLIDSRTGVSDTSGICTVQLPDDLVVCFTLNSQSINGAAAAARSAFRQRVKPDGTPGIRIWPVPTRVEWTGEKGKLEAARDATYGAFGDVVAHLGPAELDQYWKRIEVPYQAFYAFEEVLATAGDRPGHTGTVLAATEILVGSLTDGQVTSFAGMPDREAVLARYSRPIKTAADAAAPLGRPAVYVSYAHSDHDDGLVNAIADLQRTVNVAYGDHIEFAIDRRIGIQENWNDALVAQLTASHMAIIVLSPAWLRSAYCQRELRELVDLRKQIVPIVWMPVRSGLPAAIADRQLLSSAMPEVYANKGLRYLASLDKRHDEYVTTLYELAQAMVPLLDVNLATSAEGPDPRSPERLKILLVRLGEKYVMTRKSMDFSDARTRKLERVVAEMRSVAQQATGLLPGLADSPSAGSRLAAVVLLQVHPSLSNLDWLASRLGAEKPFVGYHAAVALLAAARKFGRTDNAELVAAVKRARKSFRAHSFDSDREHVLDTALEELRLMRADLRNVAQGDMDIGEA